MDETVNLSKKWRPFITNLGSYVIIMVMLMMINLLTSSDHIWFIWPVMGWGVGLAFHLLATVLCTDENEIDIENQTVVEDERTKEAISRNGTEKKENSPNKNIQTHLEQARAYREQIAVFIQSTSDGNAYRLRNLVEQVNKWTEAIEELALHINSIQQNSLIRQDLRSVPLSIKKLKEQLASETNTAIITELERTLASREEQLAVLEHLQTAAKQAEIKMEYTLSALGTIYSQILTSQSTNNIADYDSLSAEVDEEVNLLKDHLEALEEVKLGISR